MPPAVVIIGAGFAGYHLARRLRRHARVTLVNEDSLSYYTPFLPLVAGGLLEPRHVAVSLRESLPGCDVVVGRALRVDHQAREVHVRTLAGERTLPFDQLVLAPGSVTRTFPVPGLERAVGFKTLAEAVWLRNHMLGQMERAASDPAHAPLELSLVVVGGGYAGIEALLEVEDMLRQARRRRHQDDERLIPRLALVEASDKILPGLGARARAHTMRIMEERGIEVHLSAQVSVVDADHVQLADGIRLPARTLVWTTGVVPHPSLRDFDVPVNDRGQVQVGADLAVEGRPGVWALGDAAAVPDPAHAGAQPCPPSAQHASRQARTCAHNVRAYARQAPLQSFTYRTRGLFADLAHRQGVGSLRGIELRGILAWGMVRFYHFTRVPGWGRRLRMAAMMSLNALMGRDLTPLALISTPPSVTEQGA